MTNSEKRAVIKAKLGEATLDAIDSLYSIYKPELAEWFASLYDTRVGGWYYSPSARDNDEVEYQGKIYKLLPDVESTWQALGFVKESGIAEGHSEPYDTFIPDWMKERTRAFAESLEDPDGFFYHPQWGKDISPSRRGRDLGTGRAIINAFGGKPRYASVVDAGSGAATESTLIPEHLRSRENFIAYLDSLNIPNESYVAGNLLIAQFPQIRAMGLAEVCIDYLNSLQHPETGHWHFETNYYAVNGLMKITCVYKNAGVLVPNAERAAQAAINAITSDEPTVGITQIWNTWYAARNVISTIRITGGNSLADSLINDLYRGAEAAILATRDKVEPFLKPGGSFSYAVKWPSIISQGSPVCIPHLAEGDVNGTVMASHLMTQIIFDALELSELSLPLFGKREGEAFLDVVNSNRQKFG